MAVGCRRADAGPARRVGEGEAGRALLRDQIERGADQRLAQIAVVIAAPPAVVVALPGPAHVKGFYIRTMWLSLRVNRSNLDEGARLPSRSLRHRAGFSR